MEEPFLMVEDEFIHYEYIEFNTVDDSYYKISKTNRLSTSSYCNCDFNVMFQLPCRHILKVRYLNGLRLFDEGLIAKRWTKEYVKTNHRMFTTDNFESELNEFEKINIRQMDEIKELINTLQDAASKSSTLDHKITTVKELINIVEQDGHVKVMSLDCNSSEK